MKEALDYSNSPYHRKCLENKENMHILMFGYKVVKG